MAARPADSRRARRVKLAVFALLVLGAALSAVLGLRLLGKLYPRVTVVQEQASALNLARRPEPVPPLRWAPGPADALLDGVSREDVRLAYLLGHAELTYARRSGDLTGLTGLFTGAALQQAQEGARGLLLDWDHRAQLRRVALSGPAPADGDRVELRDRYWVATARPGGRTWTDIVVARRRLDVTLLRRDGRWRISALRPVQQEQPTPGPVRTLTPGVASWRALTLPRTWATWTPQTWDLWVGRAHRLHLGPLWVPLSSPPTRAELLALGVGVGRAHRTGMGVVPAFTTPLTLEAVPLRAQVIAQLPPGTLAFDPGPLDPSSAGTVAALSALRLDAPQVALVATLRGQAPEPAAGERAGLSGTVTTSAAVAADHAETVLSVPARGLLPPLPWKRRALNAALAAAGERGGWRAPLTDVLGPDGQPTARGTLLIRPPAAP